MDSLTKRKKSKNTTKRGKGKDPWPSGKKFKNYNVRSGANRSIRRPGRNAITCREMPGRDIGGP